MAGVYIANIKISAAFGDADRLSVSSGFREIFSVSKHPFPALLACADGCIEGDDAGKDSPTGHGSKEHQSLSEWLFTMDVQQRIPSNAWTNGGKISENFIIPCKTYKLNMILREVRNLDLILWIFSTYFRWKKRFGILTLMLAISAVWNTWSCPPVAIALSSRKN